MREYRIVFLRSNPVNPDSRVEKEVNSLIKAGYRVTVLAWDRDSKYSIKKSKLYLPNGVADIIRFGIPSTYGEGFKNIIPFLTFQMRLLFWLILNRKQFDLIHACDFDTAYIALQCKKYLKKKLVFDIFDFLYTQINGRFRLFKKIIVKLQHEIINRADGTIICNEIRREQIKGSKPKRLAVIHNSPSTYQSTLPKLSLNKNKIKIAYVGILQDGRYLKELTNVISNHQKYELHIAGFGKYEKYFEEISKHHKNIIFYGKLSYDKTLQLEASCDIMTAIYDPSVQEHFYAAPNKFYEALMLGKPLIMVKRTGMSEIVEKYNIGETIEYNSESLESALTNLVKRKDDWQSISNLMQSIYFNEFSWDIMETRLLQLYDDIFNINKESS